MQLLMLIKLTSSLPTFYPGSCQDPLPPEQCAQTFRITQNGTDIYIMPGVVNCFSCALMTNGNVSWVVTVAGDFMLVFEEFPNATTNGIFLIIAENYVQPGPSGRQTIVCISRDNDGDYFVATLASPGNN